MKLAGSDLRLLRVFDAVVRHAGFSAAQAELNVSQSTISNHITALEQRLGVRLCQRGRSGFKLTEKGEATYRAIQRLMRSLEEFSSEVDATRGKLVGELKIGLIDSIVTDPDSKIDSAIALFKSHPNDVSISIRQHSPQSLQQAVLEGDLHIGIGSFPHKINGLIYEPIYTESHGLYCGRLHSLFDVPDDQISVPALQKTEMAGRGYWREQIHRNLGFDNVTASVYQIEPQLMLILSGQFIGFLPNHYAKQWVEAGELRRLAANEISYSCLFDLVLKKGYRKTLVVETFLEDIRESRKQPKTPARSL